MAFDPTKSGWNGRIQRYGTNSDKAIRAIVYADYGVGKSTLASTFPNPLFIDIDVGENEAQRVGGFPYITVFSKDNPYNFISNFLTAALKGSDVFDIDGGPLAKTQTIIVDSITALSRILFIESCLASDKDILNDKTLGYSPYRILKSRLESLTELCKLLNVQKHMNILFTAIPTVEGDDVEELKRDTSDESGFTRVVGRPKVDGGYRTTIGADFDDVFYYAIEDGKHILWTVDHKSFRAKTRLKLPPSIVIPTINDGYNLISAGLRKAS